MGDLGDLRTLAEWTRSRGAGVLAVNPLHAATPIIPQQPSPYFPSTRRWSNPLYLRVEDVPGATDDPALDELAAAGRALNHERRIDRDAVYALKLAALERLWRRFPGDAAFEQFVTDGGDDLAEFATFCVLAEHHGTGWRRWPAEHRSPDRAEVAAVRRDVMRDRVRFHAWLQWLIDRQLMAAGADDLMIADLAVGHRPGWRRRLERPGRPRPRRAGRRTARRVQHAGSGLGLASVHPVAAARGRLRAVHPDHPSRHAARSGHPDRSRDGSVPPVLDPAERRAGEPGHTSAFRVASSSTSSPSRASEPERSWSARTSARSRLTSGSDWPPPRCSPTGSCWFESVPPEEYPGPGAGRGDHA